MGLYYEAMVIITLHSIQATSGSNLIFMLSAKTPGGDPRHKKL